MKSIKQSQCHFQKWDFDNLDFHDCKVHALGFDENKFLLDIDLIQEWNLKRKKYTFSMCPATLVFENTWDIEIDIGMNSDLILDRIERSNPQVPSNIQYLPSSSKEYDWDIELLQGEIRFKSIELKIYLRQDFVLSRKQHFDLEERGGISLKQEGLEIICI